MNALQVITIVALAIGVLVSYRLYLTDNTNTYLTSKFWYGIPKNIVIMILVFQVLAVAGFIVALVSWFIKPPTEGLLSEYLFIILVVFFVSSILWSVSINYGIPLLTVLSLIVTALASILMLVGSMQEKKPRLHIVLGLLLLCIVTVLCDAVVWNAQFITSTLKP